MSNNDTPLDTFLDHGVHFHKQPLKGQAVGDCPFCGKEEHFFVDVTTGKADCKVCGWKGNAYTYLKDFHAQCFKETTPSMYKELSSVRGNLPPKLLKESNLAYDSGNSRWLIPATNGAKGLSNLYHWDNERDPKGPFSTKGCKQQLLGMENLRPTGTIWLCEGYFDMVALVHLLQKNKVDLGSNSVLAVPGATVFSEPWAKQFKGRDFVLLYDNDDAGNKGMDRAKALLAAAGCTVRTVNWPNKLPEGYDIRDHVTTRLKDPKGCWKLLLTYLDNQETIRASRTLPKRETFKAVLADFKKVLHMKQAQNDALAVMMAVVASNSVKNNPLWMFLVGPPGSGKTTLMESFRGLEERCEYMSKFTATSFISGFDTGSDGTDPSLLNRIQGRTLMVQDYTAINSLPEEAKESLDGILRTAYDGEAEISYGNGIVRKFPGCHFTLIAGVTHVINRVNRSSLGERFLKVQLLGDDHDVEKQIMMALNGVDGKTNKVVDKQKLTDSLAGFFQTRKLNPDKLVKANDNVRNQISALAQIASISRTSIERERDGTLAYRPEVEIGGRIATQLLVLGKFLCWVLGKSKWDDEVFGIVRRTALNTVIGWSFEVIAALAKAKGGLSNAEIAKLSQTSETTVRNKMHDLSELVFSFHDQKRTLVHTITLEPLATGESQRLGYYLDPDFLDLWKRARLNEVEHGRAKHKTNRGPKQGKVYKSKAIKRVESRKVFRRG